VTATAVEIALVLFIGMGPIKVLVYYLTSIHDADAALGRRIAVWAVATATVTAFGLLLAGAMLMQLLHFSAAALVVAGGTILLAYGIQMVLRATPGEPGRLPETETTLRRLAIYPMGVPLILNPAGIAAITIFSAEASSYGDLRLLAGLIALMGLLDLGVLWVVRPIGPRLPREATLVLEQLLGVLLAAVAIELIVLGLVAFGILDLPPRG